MTTAQLAYSKQETKVDAPWVRWVIAITVSLGALLEVLDSSIVNVALPHMQGNLGATLSEIGWVITGYSAANVVIIPLSAWLGDAFGKKGYFIFSLIGFTLSSILCGMATSLPMLVIARIIQGLAGGGLLAKAQAILFETFPPEEQAAAQGMFGICVMVGPVLGPTVGGYLTETFNWRWIFFVNIPFGIAAVICACIFMKKDKQRVKSRVDWWGILFLALSFGSIQTILEEGQKEDWFSSRMILILTVVGLSSLIAFVWRELVISYPAVELRILRYRSLWAGSIFSLILGMGLYGATFALPVFAQSFLHYNAMQTGVLLLPGALASAVAMPLFAKLSGKIDARIVIACGGILTAISMFALTSLNPDSNYDSFFWPQVIRGFGAVLMFMSLSMATLGPLPKDKIAAASGFYNLTRQMGGSIGIAAITTILDQRQNQHRSVLMEKINGFNPALNEYLQQFSNGVLAQGGNSANPPLGGMALAESLVQMQAAILSFSDCFFVAGIAFLICLPLVIFLGDGKKIDPAVASEH